MKLTIPYEYVEARVHKTWTQTLAEVVKVERSADGFRTNTGTRRPCFECRDRVPIGGAGVEPWPMATWLLHAEVFGTRTKLTLPLCSDHFKELREGGRGSGEEWGYGGVDTTPYLDGVDPPDLSESLAGPVVSMQVHRIEDGEGEEPDGPWQQLSNPIHRA